MAGGYASHGETYVHPGGILWWAAGGDLVGEAPARLGFLRSIMSSAPFQEISPAPDLADGGSALALKGQYYLLWVESAYSPSLQATEIELEGNGPIKWSCRPMVDEDLRVRLWRRGEGFPNDDDTVPI